MDVEIEETIRLADITILNSVAATYIYFGKLKNTGKWKNMEKQFMKSHIRLNNYLEELSFLQQAKRNEITPKFLQLPKKKGNRNNKIIMKAEKAMLINEIKILRSKIQRQEIGTYEKHLKIGKFLNTEKWEITNNKIYQILKRKIETKKKKLTKKLEWLKSKNSNIKLAKDYSQRYTAKQTKVPQTNEHPQDKQDTEQNEEFVNLSSKQVTEAEKDLLNKGSKYIIKNKIPLDEFIAEIENNLKTVKEEVKDTLRKKAYSIYKDIKPEWSALNICKSLYNNEEIMILKADKANKLVLLDKDDYKIKIEQVLAKLDVEVIDENPINNWISDVTNLKQAKYLPTELKQNCKVPPYTDIPKLFCQVKIHKDGFPLRPLVCKRSAPTYLLEKALVNIFKTMISDSPHSVNSSVEAKEKIMQHKKQVNESTILASMDVKDLFPSVNVNLVKQLIIKKLKLENKYNEKEIRTIIRALELVMKTNYFTVNNIIYKQEKGLPMGSPLSPVLSEIMLQFIEQSVFKTLKLHPTLYIRYVDDTFLIWPHGKEELEKLLENFNKACTSLKFTLEVEENHALPFLDMKVIRENSNLHIQIHHKPTADISFINAKSSHPYQYKTAALRTYIHRAFKLTTKEEFKNEEINYLKSKFLKAGYEPYEFDRIYRKVRNKLYPKTYLQKIENEKSKSYSTITFQEELKQWYKLLQRAKNENKGRITFRTLPKNIDLIKKDRTRTEPKSGVYAIKINDKENEETHKIYIGQTSRYIDKRLKEHQSDLQTKQQNIPKTALAEYCHNSKNTDIEWNKTEIIKRPRSPSDLETFETIQIIINKNFVVNKRVSVQLPKYWETILEENKNSLNHKVLNIMYKEITNKIVSLEDQNIFLNCFTKLQSKTKNQQQQQQNREEEENITNKQGGNTKKHKQYN